MEIFVERIHHPPVASGGVEMVERKGAGHPDTLCDRAAEEFSIALSKYYIARFGRILHHNVDKCVLVGGKAVTAYGGGRVVEPMELILVGRAVDSVSGEALPVRDIAKEATSAWLRGALRHLDAEKDIVIETRIRPGSAGLVTAFDSSAEMPLANDTSIGVGYAPLTPLEGLVLGLDGYLGSSRLKGEKPELGEDVKIMAVRRGGEVYLTVAAAFVDRAVHSASDYMEKKRDLTERLDARAGEVWGKKVHLAFNAADQEESESFYLTVTGTSAESGDDGQVGRGNRVNGLIAPYRPMVMEAAAGKNPVSHVGKLYNLAASVMASELVGRDGITEAEVYMVSRIGSPINQPQIVDVRVRSELSDKEVREAVESEVGKGLDGLGGLWRNILDKKYGLF